MSAAMMQFAAGLLPGASTPDPLAIHSPSIEYRALAPMLIVFGAATVGVLFEAFLRDGSGLRPDDVGARSASWLRSCSLS